MSNNSDIDGTQQLTKLLLVDKRSTPLDKKQFKNSVCVVYYTSTDEYSEILRKIRHRLLKKQTLIGKIDRVGILAHDETSPMFLTWVSQTPEMYTFLTAVYSMLRIGNMTNKKGMSLDLMCKLDTSSTTLAEYIDGIHDKIANTTGFQQISTNSGVWTDLNRSTKSKTGYKDSSPYLKRCH